MRCPSGTAAAATAFERGIAATGGFKAIAEALFVMLSAYVRRSLATHRSPLYTALSNHVLTNDMHTHSAHCDIPPGRSKPLR